MPDTDQAKVRHWLLPQEVAYRRWAAHMLARRPGPNPQRETFEKLYGPRGVAYFEAAIGDMVGAGMALIGGVVVTGTGLPYQVGNWFFLAGLLFALIALARFRPFVGRRGLLRAAPGRPDARRPGGSRQCRACL